MSKYVLQQCEKYNHFFDEALEPQYLTPKPSPMQNFLEAFVPKEGVLVLKHTVDRSKDRQHGHIEVYWRKDVEGGGAAFMSLLLDDETKLGKGNKVVVSCFTPSGHCLKHTRRKSEGVVNPVEGEAGDIKIYDCATHEFIPLGTLARYLEAAGERDFDWSYYASTDALRATAKGKDEIAKLFPFEPQQLLCNTGLSVEKGNDNLVFGKRADENFFDGASRANEMIPERDDTFLLRNFLRNKHGVSLAATQITPPSLVFAAQIAAKQGGKDFS